MIDLLSALGITADSTRLLHALRPRLTPELVRDIARADYELDLELHLVALERLLDTGEIPDPLPRHPRKVIEALRWLEPDAVGWSSGRTGQPGHLIRALACTV